MSQLIQGSCTNGKTRQAIFAQFVHRWTHENARQTFRGECPACAQGAPESMTKEQWHAYHAPLVSDAQWLADHAFYVNNDGSLDQRRGYCEPAYLADLNCI